MRGISVHVAFFLLTSAVTALVPPLAREGQLRRVWREATHFFFLILGGIGALTVVVYLLEWIFIRKG